MMVDLAEVHKLVLAKISHEDTMLQVRTYNFLTENTFLAAILAVFLSSSNSEPVISYLISVLGLFLSVIQIALGRRAERAILFWRVYVQLLENKIDMPLDSALFKFYKAGSSDVFFGKIVTENHSGRPMYETIPWSLPFLRSSNVMIGVLIPTVITIFWAGLLYSLAGICCEVTYWGFHLLIPLLAISAIFYLWYFTPAKPQVEQ